MVLSKETKVEPRTIETANIIEGDPFSLIQKKMVYDIEKAKLLYEKMNAYFIGQIDCAYKQVFDTKGEKYVTPFPQKKIHANLDNEIKELRDLVDLENNGCCLDEPLEIKLKKEEVKDESDLEKIPLFLKDLENLIPKLPIRIQRALKKYYSRVEEIRNTKKMFESFEKSKPDENKLLLLEKAESHGVNKKNKTDPNNREPKNKRISLTFKQLKILETKKELFDMRNAFNDKFRALEKDKIEMIRNCQRLKNRFIYIQKLIPEQYHETFPTIPTINYELEYPELKFEVDWRETTNEHHQTDVFEDEILNLLKPVEVTVGQVENDTSFRNVSIDLETKRDIPSYSQTLFKFDNFGTNDQAQTSDNAMQETLVQESSRSHDDLSHQTSVEVDLSRSYILKTLENKKYWENVSNSSLETMPSYISLSTVSTELSTEDILAFYALDQQESALERQLKQDAVIRLIFEQTQCKNQVNLYKEEFDKRVEQLSLERCPKATEIKLMELYLITLKQELIVLKTYHAKERESNKVINTQVQIINSKQDTINELQKEIQKCQEEIQNIVMQIKGIEDNFLSATKTDENANFLAKIFHKKYKPKPTKSHEFYDDDDNIDSTSSEDEADLPNNSNIRSGTRPTIVYNENVWPPNLKEELLTLTVEYRTEKNAKEHELIQLNNEVANLTKKIRFESNSLQHLRNNLNDLNEDLEKILSEMLLKVNEIEATVVLNISQLQYGNADLENCVLLPSSEFLWLCNRSNELEQETLAQKKLYLEYNKTLNKIRNSNKKYEEEIRNLKAKVNEVTIKKYGKLVNINELEEIVLQKLIKDVRFEVPEITKALNNELKIKEAKLVEEEKILLELLKEENEVVILLKTLEEEKNKLQDEIDNINAKKNQEKTRFKYTVADYKKDVEKLTKIYESMLKEEELITKEICDLTFKCKYTPRRLPSIEKTPKLKTSKVNKDKKNSGETLQNSKKKMKKILSKLEEHGSHRNSIPECLVEDLKELYAMDLKDDRDSRSMDSMVDVLIDLATKDHEESDGVSNVDVMKVTLSMMLADLEKIEHEALTTNEIIDDEVDNGSEQSEISNDENNDDIIKVSLSAEDKSELKKRILADVESIANQEDLNEVGKLVADQITENVEIKIQEDLKK